MNAIHEFLYVGASAKIVQVILVAAAGIIVPWAYARQALGFRLLKKTSLKSKIAENDKNEEAPIGESNNKLIPAMDDYARPNEAVDNIPRMASTIVASRYLYDKRRLRKIASINCRSSVWHDNYCKHHQTSSREQPVNTVINKDDKVSIEERVDMKVFVFND